MPQVLPFVAPILIAAVVVLVVRSLVRSRREGLEVARSLVQGEIRLEDPTANFKGFESGRGPSVVGNGALLCTDREVLFRMWTPKRILRIPRADILRVESAKPITLFGRDFYRPPLFRILHRTEEGGEDWIYFQVEDLSAWLGELGWTDPRAPRELP